MSSFSNRGTHTHTQDGYYATHCRSLFSIPLSIYCVCLYVWKKQKDHFIRMVVIVSSALALGFVRTIVLPAFVSEDLVSFSISCYCRCCSIDVIDSMGNVYIIALSAVCCLAHFFLFSSSSSMVAHHHHLLLLHFGLFFIFFSIRCVVVVLVQVRRQRVCNSTPSPK